MKKINLIGRLWKDSHEKQKVRSVRRYAAMLLLLLTCVTHAWAGSGTIYVTPANMYGSAWDYTNSTLKIGYNYNPNSQWTGEQAMTKTDYTFHNYPVYSYSISSSDNWVQIFIYHYKSGTKQDKDGYGVSGGWMDFSDYYGKMYNGWHNSAHEWLTTSDFDANTEVTVYYAYQNTNSYTIKANMCISNDYDVWRTYTMTSTGHMIGNKTIYKCTFNDFREHLYVLQFQRHNGSGFVSQDQPINNSWTGMATYKNKMYNGSSWVAYQYDVTLDMQSGTGGSSSVTAVCGSAMPEATMPTRDGYTFAGYYTEEDGGGTKYYNADGTSAANWPSNGTGPTTLYAYWTEDPGIAWAASTPVSAYSLVSGESVTLNVTRSNSSSSITYKYKIGSGSWTTIEETTNTSCTFRPTNTGETATYYFKAILNDGTPAPETTSSSAVTVYGKKTIHVRNTNDWATFKMHHWGDADATTMPGSTAGITAGVGQWKDVVILSSYTGFILNDGAKSGGHQSYDLGYTTIPTSQSVTDGSYWEFATASSSVDGAYKHNLTLSSAPAKPTVTTDDATASSSTSATFGAHLTAVNRDKVTTYGVIYKQSDSNIASAEALAAATPSSQDFGAVNSGTANNTTTQTVTAGKDWYYAAFATNGKGTSYGDLKKLRTTAVTLAPGSGYKTAGTTSVVAIGGRTISSITAPTKTGYNFAGYWTGAGGTGTKYYNADGSANVATWPTDLGATLTLTAHWTAKTTTVTLDVNTATSGSNQTVTATYNAAMPLLTTSSAAIALPSKTGYTLLGYWDATSSGKKYYDYSGSPATLSSANNWDKEDATKTLYARWQANQYTLTLYKNDGGGTSTSATATYDATITVSAPTRTGYTFTGYWTTASSDGVQIIGTDGHFVNNKDGYTSTTGNKWQRTSNTDLYARWTANEYTVTLDVNGATSGSNQIVTATYDASMPLTDTSAEDLATPEKTGYTFGGYWQNSNGTGTQYYTNALASANSWDQASNTSIYAKWTAKSYTITLNVDQSHKGSIDDATESVSATYDATMPSIGGTMPTAEEGYRYMGMFTSEGVALTDSLNNWLSNVDGYISDGKWVHDGAVTLYAHYVQAEIIRLVLSPSTQAPGETVTATPTISPTPAGTTKLCWKILRSNGNLLTDEGFTPGSGNSVSFAAPSASGSYKVKCVLRTGSDCAGGTALDSILADLVVAGEHTVTVRYQDSDGRTLAASTEVTGRPLTWTETDIKAPTITGYTFHHWAAGDGVSLSKDGTNALNKDTAQLDSIFIKATYEGTLTAVYNKRRMVYFNNTLGWSSVYVYFYSDATAWDDSDNGQGTSSKRGSGAKTDKIYNGSTYPYSAGHHGEMQNIAGTNIWYFDMATAGYSDCANITFTKDDQHGYEYFSNTEIVRVTNAPYNSTTLPMYVPIPGVKEEHNKLSDGKKAVYYTKGYWMNYPNNTGYWLKIFNKIAKANEEDSAPVCIQDIPFEYTGDMTMPMTVTAELDEGVTYGFKIYRNDATWYGNTGTMKSGASGDTGETVWEFTNGASSNCGLKTSIAGEYKFTLNYAPKSGTYYYLVGVHYPVAANDYRIVYKDQATWSQGTAHSASWYHPSRAIHKENGAEDIVSFYVSKAVGASASMKFQKVSSISNEGVVTWADSTGGSIDLTGITKSGVYNFYLTQANGVISVSKIEPYEGNYYIRTDCAGSTKWDNYRANDHKMTYTEFSSSPSTNEFGDLYTHYYMHWCPRETNVKFVIANDYSMCITDTLTQDVGDTYSNITSGGFLKSQKGEGKTEEQDIYSANIRFMYNESTNVITRAYMSSSTEASRKFLVLRSNAKFTDNGKPLSGSGEVSDDVNHIYEAIFEDDQDWIYERKIKVKPGSKFKLYASYAQVTAQEDGSQHFRGAYASNDWTTSTNYVELIGGSGDSCIVRVVYDFKTNRLMSAYVPEEGDIAGTLAINADIMLIRDHQEAGQQLTFANAESALTDVKTVYGVMRFNRWILNNRQHPEDHDKEHSDTQAHINEYHPLISTPGDLKSSSERGLYWISFPFDVKLSEVFGFGTYGTDWVFMGYNGAERAKEGYWQDSEGFWEYIWDRRDTVLAAGHGIVLALDLDRMGAANTSFWANEIQQVELFFPSLSSTTGTIKQTDASVTLASHQCTIDRRTDEEKAAQEANPATHDTNKDRTVVDSHWNLLGVPSYANYEGTLKHLYGVDQDSVISWNSNPETQDLPFLYEWNANDNTYTVQSGNTYTFKAMHAYYVQFAGKVKWTLASATPASIVARRTYAEKPQNVEFKLELQQNSKMIDQTFVKLSEDEEVSAGFVFGEDLSKSLNKNKANIYTLIEGYLPTAGNTLPMTEQTMMIPVGVKPAKEGEYTFSMPEGTEGIGVTLIDNEAGIRTNLGLTDYVVTLNAGKIENRFVLEISPIKNTPTGVEAVTGDGLQVTGVRKVMIDGILYIVKDGVIYDARGNRVK